MSHSKNSSISDQLSYFNYPQPSMLSSHNSPQISVQSASDSMLNIPGFALDQETDPLKIILPATNPHSPYHISLPYQTTQPTEELSKRFTIWKKIIKQLIFYFKELSMLRQHYYQLNVHMLNNIQFLSLNNKNKPKKNTLSPPLENQQRDIFYGTSEDKFINYSFLPTNSHSVQGISTTLYNYHKSLSERELQTYNDLTLKIIPRLENLKKSLNFKIKEIINLKNDFKFTHLRAEVAKTGQVLNSYINSIEYLQKGFITGVKDSEIKMNGKFDPYLIKIQLDLQLKKQLLEENYLKEAFTNLQNSGLELEKIIYKELQTGLQNFTKLIENELELVKLNLIDDLKQNFLLNDPTIDWNYYMNNDNGRNFLNSLEKKKFRKLSDITYPYQRQIISLSLRSGYLHKKNKVTKTYTKFYYVLSMNYIHEFKTNDRQKDQTPILSLNLNHCSIAEYHERKFIIQCVTKDKGKTTLVFKCDDLKEALKWVSDISELVSFKSSVERNKYFELKYLSNYPQSSISSSSNSRQSSASLNTPQHQKTYSNSSLSKQNSSSSLSKLMVQDDPGKFTTHLNLSSNNLVPSINITDHSPSSRNSSGSSVMTSGKNDYFTVKPSQMYPNNNPLTMGIDKKLPSASGMRTPPKQAQTLKGQFKLNLPQQKITQSMFDELSNEVKTPGELPNTSISDIINGFQNQQLDENSANSTDKSN